MGQVNAKKWSKPYTLTDVKTGRQTACMAEVLPLEYGRYAVVVHEPEVFEGPSINWFALALLAEIARDYGKPECAAVYIEHIAARIGGGGVLAPESWWSVTWKRQRAANGVMVGPLLHAMPYRMTWIDWIELGLPVPDGER